MPSDTTGSGRPAGADRPIERAAARSATRSPNRSPRALPLPEVEWLPEVIPGEQRADFFPEHPAPTVHLAYANAKRRPGH